MKLPEPARIVQGFGMEAEYLYTAEQVRELLAQQATENEANERNLCQLTDELAESRREVAQVQEQNTTLDAKLAQHEEAMKMALAVLRHNQHDVECVVRSRYMGEYYDPAIKALEDALK